MRRRAVLKRAPENITLCDLEVVVMPNGEVICLGKSLGWVSSFRKVLVPRDADRAERATSQAVPRSRA